MYMWIRFFLFTCGICDSLYRQSNIVLKDNGYSNILLAIHDSVTDETIVDKIKVGYTNRKKGGRVISSYLKTTNSVS